MDKLEHASFLDDHKRRTYLFAIGDRISWKAATQINKLLLMGIPKDYQILEARLLSEEGLVPTLLPKIARATDSSVNPQEVLVNERQHA